jgi:Iron-containing redox enzyme
VVGGPTASGILKAKVELAQRSAGSVYERFWNGACTPALLASLQLRTYDVARASVSLMEAALARCQALTPADSVAVGLIPYLSHHIEEERNHDVWLLEDLEALGVSRQQVLERPPSLTAARLVGAQYYWIYHDYPIALVGYMAVLEGCLVSEDFLEDFICRSRIPRAGVRTLLLHARIDYEHEAGLDKLIDGLPLTSRHIAAMGLSALHTVSLLATLTQEVMDEEPGRVAATSMVNRV